MCFKLFLLWKRTDKFLHPEHIYIEGCKKKKRQSPKNKSWILILFKIGIGDMSYLKLNALGYGPGPQGICSSVYFVEVWEAEL